MGEKRWAPAPLRWVLALGLVAGGVWCLRWGGTPDAIGGLLRAFRSAGALGPALYVAAYVLACCLFVPSSVMTAWGALVFGPWAGFLYAWVGGILGASAAFGLSRALAGRPFSRLGAGRLRRLEGALAARGLETVFLLRLACVPFTPLNFGMGLTRVRFADYFWGTVFGVAGGTLVFSLVAGEAGRLWRGGTRGGAVEEVAVLAVCGLGVAALAASRKRSKAALDRQALARQGSGPAESVTPKDAEAAGLGE